MRYLSLCSGIEAATVAWHPLGWEPAAFAEIEKFPSAVLAHHYPAVPNLGDMTKFQDWPDLTHENTRPPISLLVGGTPCQSFSVAGLRKGLDDPRGNLMLTFGAIAARYRPTWLVWENVPGVLSSNSGKDFAAFLGLITGQEVGVPDEGWQNSGVLAGYAAAYGVARRVLDAQYFGVAQRRRRVFVVGHLGGCWQRAAAVLLERESLRGDSAPSREAGQRAAPTISARPTGGGGLGTDFDCDRGVIALQERGREGGRNLEMQAEVAYSLNAPNKGGRRQEMNIAQPIAFPQNLSGTQCASAEDIAPAMGARNPTAIAFAQNTRDEVRAITGNIAGALAAEPGMKQQTYVAIGIEGGDVGYALRANASHSGDKGDGGVNTTMVAEVAPCLTGNYGKQPDNSDTSAGPMLVPCLTASNDPSRSPQSSEVTQQVAAVHAASMAVRRLTPVECERLQGFPDNFTDIRANGKPTPDGPRYKALGNSFAVPVVNWIGKRIQMVDAVPWEKSAPS